MGLYVSTNGKGEKSRYVKGTCNDFNLLLTIKKRKKYSTECIDKGFTLLYNKDSNESRNKFIFRYVANTNINGPVIIIRKDKSGLDTKTHTWIGKKVLSKCVWLGYTIIV